MASKSEHPAATESMGRRLPIFAAKYRDHAIAILRNTDYDIIVALVRTAFQIPTTIPDSQIRLSSRFDEFGDLSVELTCDVWKEVAPVLKVVEVSTQPRPLARLVVPEIVESRHSGSVQGKCSVASIKRSLSTSCVDVKGPTPDVTSTTVHIIGGPTDLSIPISDACTLSELKEKVFRNETRLPNQIDFHYQDVRLADDQKELRAYGVIDQSIITMMTSVQVYVTTPERSKVPMRVTLYADVSSLKLLIHARLDIPIYEQILMCAGEELLDGTQLGSYPQLSHNCQIIVDVTSVGAATQSLMCIEVKPAWASGDDNSDDDSYMYYVLPNSTILDLKVLIYNLNLISPSRQRLEFRGETLKDEQNMNEAEVVSGSTLIMHIMSQRA